MRGPIKKPSHFRSPIRKLKSNPMDKKKMKEKKNETLWLVIVVFFGSKHFLLSTLAKKNLCLLATFSMAFCFTELTSSLFGAAYRKPKPFTTLLSTNTKIKRTINFQPLNSSPISRIFRNNHNKLRRFTVLSSTSSPPQTTDDSDDVSTVIPIDNRIPATIITGFLGSGKVSSSFLSFSYPFQRLIDFDFEFNRQHC